MNRYIQSLFLLVLAVTLAGCEKYLDVQPKGVVIPNKLSDYEQILNSETLIQSYPSHLFYASDDVWSSGFTKVDGNSAVKAYFWVPQLDADTESNPAIWGRSYRAIYNTNVIINQVMSAPDGTEQKKQQIQSEALVHRAELYFNLLTAFAKGYNKSTAASDPGVPFVTAIDVTEEIPPRSSVQAVLDILIQDLKTAAEHLPATNISRSRVSKYVAYGMLSRIYLYMHDYPNAQLYAEKALQASHALNDFNSVMMETGMLPTDYQDPQMLWIKQSEDLAVHWSYPFSQELVDLYEPDDLRGKDWFILSAEYSPGEVYYGRYDFGVFGMDIAEMYLTRAEALARNNQVAEAMDIINELRSKRIADYAFEPLEVSDKEEALEIVLAERRRELVFRGTRWMDMKRLDAEGRMPDVKRLDAAGSVIETLPARSPRYTFEIPGRVMLFNPSMPSNH